MPHAIHVEHDAEGLQIALRALFEESFVLSLNEGMYAGASDDVRERLEQELPARELSPGYYRRAQYLLDLQSSMEVGCHYDAAALSRTDVAGLKALQAARNDFEREHFPCGRCGARQHNKFIEQCRNCEAKFTRAA